MKQIGNIKQKQVWDGHSDTACQKVACTMLLWSSHASEDVFRPPVSCVPSMTRPPAHGPNQRGRFCVESSLLIHVCEALSCSPLFHTYRPAEQQFQHCMTFLWGNTPGNGEPPRTTYMCWEGRHVLGKADMPRLSDGAPYQYPRTPVLSTRASCCPCPAGVPCSHLPRPPPQGWPQSVCPHRVGH